MQQDFIAMPFGLAGSSDLGALPALGSLARYFAGLASKSLRQSWQQSLISWPSWTKTTGLPSTPSFSSETMHLSRG